MNEIRLLDPIVANQIAAGEVVERPASVIKELVENSLDAGATVIHVEADQGGRFLRVVDNGHGIPAESLALAFQRFATSKLQDYQDIWQLATMGFRGEALPSIASVSKLEVLSRTHQHDLAHRLLIHGGELLESGPGGAPVGTSLTINELFYNTPARLKFMSSENTELGYIQQLMQAFALSHPQVAFRFHKKGKQSINTTGRSDLMGAVRQVFGKDMAASLFSIEHVYRDAKIEGVLSYPDNVRKDRNYQYFFVNQRWVKVPALTKILDDLFADLIPRRNYPVAILKLTLPPETVDINVHPTKREVRFKNFSLVYQLLKESLDQALLRYHPERVHLNTLYAPNQVADRQTTSSYSNSDPAVKPAPEAIADEDIPPFAAEISIHPGLPLAERQPIESAPWNYQMPRQDLAVGSFQESQSVYHSSSAEVLPLPELSPWMQSQQKRDPKADEKALLEHIVPIGQVCENTYIIGSYGRDLFLIDQHVAEERYLYENLIERGESARQPVLLSIIVELDAIEQDLIEKHRDVFALAGFEYETYGPQSIAIRTLPQCLKFADAEATFKALLTDLRETGIADSHLEAYKKTCKTLACHSAIRAGDALNIEQMREIVKNWAKTKNPYTCPHGRPILLKLTKDEINRRFLRTWS